MPPLRQRQWHAHTQQQALLEYGSLKYACPEGIYMSLTPGNFAVWSGVFFIAKGIYARAVLRVQVTFPPRYPSVLPLVTFTSDIFHPLVTPLTTYTYTTGSSGSDTVSATDEARLAPGGFSLRHGFPKMFEREETRAVTPKLQLPSMSESSDESDDPQMQSRVGRNDSLSRMGMLEEPGTDKLSPSIIEILQYVKRAFEDENILDELPLDAAGNPGAWHAWQAHRSKTMQETPSTPRIGILDPSSPHYRKNSSDGIKPLSGWNWDGVWAERVKKGVNASISEQMLYGNPDSHDLIHFLDVDDEVVDMIRKSVAGDIEK